MTWYVLTLLKGKKSGKLKHLLAISSLYQQLSGSAEQNKNFEKNRILPLNLPNTDGKFISRSQRLGSILLMTGVTYHLG